MGVFLCLKKSMVLFISGMIENTKDFILVAIGAQRMMVIYAVLLG